MTIHATFRETEKGGIMLVAAPNEDIIIGTAGLGKIKYLVDGVLIDTDEGGGQATQGIATLVNGQVTVTNTSVTALSRIDLSVYTALGAPGYLSSVKSAGASFTIVSTSADDQSVIFWQIEEPPA